MASAALACADKCIVHGGIALRCEAVHCMMIRYDEHWQRAAPETRRIEQGSAVPESASGLRGLEPQVISDTLVREVGKLDP